MTPGDQLLLNATPLFLGLSPAEAEAIYGCIRPTVSEYQAGEIIALSGEPMHTIGFILAGSAIITRESEGGARSVLGSTGPGDLFGEMAALSSLGYWPATVVSSERTRVAFIDSSSFLNPCEKACKGHGLLLSNMLQMMSRKALSLQRRLELLELRTLRGKISAYLLAVAPTKAPAKLTLALSREELADFMNVARPSLSREMSLMARDGLIRYRRAHVELLDRQALAASVL
jgi:CRP-like cAMP-binding protein